MVTAREKLRVARALADGLPAVVAALATGSISYGAARAITRLPDADANTEAALVRAAKFGVSVGQLEALVRRARDTVDPDGANAEAERDFDRRGLHLTRGMAGSVLGQFELDAEAGELLMKAIDSVLAFERATGNPVVPSPVDSRECTGVSTVTPAQRRADAMMALITAGLEHFEEQQPGRARTELLVLVDHDTLVDRAGGTAQTGSGAPVTAEQVRRLCCDANLRRIVTKGGSELLDVGTRTPTFTTAQCAAMHVFHDRDLDRYLLPLVHEGARALPSPRLERAIGVVYRPQTERAGHWFHARLPDQFDAVIHFDRTSAVEPLERTALWDEGRTT